MYLQAAIVRIMKARKILKHAMLIQEVNHLDYNITVDFHSFLTLCNFYNWFKKNLLLIYCGLDIILRLCKSIIRKKWLNYKCNRVSTRKCNFWKILCENIWTFLSMEYDFNTIAIRWISSKVLFFVCFRWLVSPGPDLLLVYPWLKSALNH